MHPNIADLWRETACVNIRIDMNDILLIRAGSTHKYDDDDPSARIWHEIDQENYPIQSGRRSEIRPRSKIWCRGCCSIEHRDGKIMMIWGCSSVLTRRWRHMIWWYSFKHEKRRRTILWWYKQCVRGTPAGKRFVLSLTRGWMDELGQNALCMQSFLIWYSLSHNKSTVEFHEESSNVWTTYVVR